MSARRACCLALAGLAIASALQAQSANLSVAEQLVAAGRTAEAREMVADWWEAYGEIAPAGELQRALWLRGRLTLDPVAAAGDYERLVAEFRGGPYSDDALLRLALAAEAAGDLVLAEERFRSLAMDYPTRPAGQEAARWLEGRPDTVTAESKVPATADAPPEPRVAGAISPAVAEEERTAAADADTEPETAPEASADPVVDPTPDAPATMPEPVDESDAPADTLDAPEAASVEPQTPPATYAVEIGGYLSQTRAERMVERLAANGHSARIAHVPGSPLYRVRVGRFDDRTSAEQLRARIQALDFSATIVQDVPSEEPPPGAALDD